MTRLLAAILGVLLLAASSAAQPLGNPQRVSVLDSGTACSVAYTCASFAIAEAQGVTIQVSGTFTGTLTFEATADGANYKSVSVAHSDATAAATTVTATGLYSFTNPGYVFVRARATAAMTGEAVVVARGGASGSTGGGGGGSGGAVTLIDGADTTFGTTTDPKSTATDATAATAMQVLKEISALEQAPASRAVTNAGTFSVQCSSGCSGGTQYTQDAALTVGSTVGTMAMGRASAAVPTDVSADGDAVIPWYLRSGAHVTQPSFGGVLASVGNGVSGTGVPRFTIASDSTGQFAITGVTLNSGRLPVLADINNPGATGTLAGTSSVAYVGELTAGTLKSGGTASMTGTTSTSVIAGTASNYTYVSSCSVSNTHASVDTLVDLQDGSGGTVIWTFVAVHGYGGESHPFGLAPLKVPTIGNGVFAVNETTGAAVKVFCNGFYTTLSN